MDETTYLTKIDCRLIAEEIKENGSEEEQYVIDELIDNDGMYLCNFFYKETRNIIGKYGCYVLSECHCDDDWKKRLRMMNPKNFGEEIFKNDSEIILMASFSEIKSMTLDKDSANCMIPLFKQELRDQHEFIEDDEDIEEAIDYFEKIVEECDWTNEEGVFRSFLWDLKEINDELDSDEQIEILMKNLKEDGYFDLHKLSVDNYLIFTH